MSERVRDSRLPDWVDEVDDHLSTCNKCGERVRWCKTKNGGKRVALDMGGPDHFSGQIPPHRRRCRAAKRPKVRRTGRASRSGRSRATPSSSSSTPTDGGSA